MDVHGQAQDHSGCVSGWVNGWKYAFDQKVVIVICWYSKIKNPLLYDLNTVTFVNLFTGEFL